MGVEFRPARAADVEVAVPLMYSAGPEAFDYMLCTSGLCTSGLHAAGRETLAFLRHAFADGRGYQGYRNHWVVERDGQVLGIGAFYSGREDPRLARGTVAQVLGFYPLGAALGVVRRALQLAPLMKPVTRDMIYVANLGVAPAARGQGLGAALLNFRMHEARKAGFRRFALDVAVTNPRAQKLYEGLGLSLVNERAFRGDRRRAPVPDCRRLERSLN